MGLVVFLRAVNVGGHNTFRPALLAKELSQYDVVNIGAAGTFVVRRPGAKARFLKELRQKVPFDAEVMVCDGGDVIAMAAADPFRSEPSVPDVVRFVSVLGRPGCKLPPLPLSYPADGDWLVRITGSSGQFIFGTYRRHMKAIGYLSQVEKRFGLPMTTRNWNTVDAIVRVLNQPK
jgi:uncharacterized protein (DUF1697 family)